MEDFIAKCRKDNMDNFLCVAGDSKGKRAFIGEGNPNDAILALTLCMMDREDIFNIVSKAVGVVKEMKSQIKKQSK